MKQRIQGLDIIRRLVSYTVLAVVVASPLALADSEARGAALTKTRPIYLPLKPPFVVNYGGQGRLKYLKAELSVRVKDSNAANSIRHHMPFIRNNLVLLFSKQRDEDIDTQEGKELLRQAALEEIRAIVLAEDGERDDGGSGIVDLYFNNFVIQK